MEIFLITGESIPCSGTTLAVTYRQQNTVNNNLLSVMIILTSEQVLHFLGVQSKLDKLETEDSSIKYAFRHKRAFPDIIWVNLENQTLFRLSVL
jgi:hypothetical protein